MRIAIYENLPPGGARRTAFEFGRYLASRHEVDLYELGTTVAGAFDLSPHAAATYRYPYRPALGLLDRRLRRGHFAPRSLTLFGPLRRLQRKIARDLTARHYDLVLAHTDAMTQAPYLLRWTGALGVYYCHEVLRVSRELALREAHRLELRSSPPPLGNLRVLEDLLVMPRWRAADRRTAQAAGHIVANSRYTSEQVWAAYARNASVASPGVDAAWFTPGEDDRRRPEVLSIGSPLAIKGHELVIRALALIPAPRPQLRVIAGSSEGARALQARALELGVDLTLEQQVDETVLRERYRSALATVCAARLEPFGLTALESMACATPVVAIREAGFRETIVDGVTGLLAEGSVNAFASAIQSLAADPALAHRLGSQGRAAVLDHWTWDHRGQALEAILEEMVN